MKLILIDSFKTGFYLIQTLHNSYREKMNKVSSLMRDQMESPLERAVYWIEYVIRHQGAQHLRSPALYLNVFERDLIDIYLTAFASVLLIIYVCFRFFSSKRNSPSTFRNRMKQD